MCNITGGGERGKAAWYFEADWIKTLVSMATESPHWLICEGISNKISGYFLQVLPSYSAHLNFPSPHYFSIPLLALLDRVQSSRAFLMELSPASVCPFISLSVNIFLHLLQDHGADCFRTLPHCFPQCLIVQVQNKNPFCQQIWLLSAILDLSCYHISLETTEQIWLKPGSCGHVSV